MPLDGRAHFDVVVVGAGPAGSSTSAILASRNRSVLLLDRCEFPRDKACGDGLSHDSVAALSGLGLEKSILSYLEVRGTRLSLACGQKLDRQVRTEPGRVVPRTELDALLVKRACELGAEFSGGSSASELLFDADQPAGICYLKHGETRSVRCRFIVAADGAMSPIARQAGLARPGPLGIAVRAYVRGLKPATREFQIIVPLVDPNKPERTLAGYGWVFPVSDDVSNVGVGLMRLGREDKGVNLRRLFRDFVATLSDEPLEIGPLLGAPLACDFQPDSCAAPGIVLVGDAAGLVDPLSGEGIDMALQSGNIAAHSIDDALSVGAKEARGYGLRLQERFGARLASAWSIVEHHRFVWPVISATLELDRPLYRGARRAIRAYDKEPPTAEPRDALRDWLVARELHGAVRAVQTTTGSEIAGQLPMIEGAVAELRDDIATRLRIALLLICAGAPASHAQQGSRAWRQGEAIRLSVACELACLARAAHNDVLDACGDADKANLFAVSAGDALLFHAYSIAASIGAWAVKAMSQASAEVAAGTLLGLCDEPGVDPVQRQSTVIAATVGAEFALAMRLGAQLAAVDPRDVDALADMGRSIGVAQCTGERSAAVGTACEALTALCSRITATRNGEAVREVKPAKAAGGRRGR